MQDTIMQLLGNAAAIGGIVLGLMLAKSTIEGSLGSKVGGALKRFQGAAQKGAESRYKRSALGRGEAIRKQAKENYRTQKFASKLDSKGIRGAYTRAAAGGLTNLTSRVPGQKGAKAQMRALDRAAYAGARKTEDEDVGFEERRLLDQAVSEPNGQEFLSNQLRTALQSGDNVKARAAYSALYAQGQGGIEAARSTIASTSNKHAGASTALRQHILSRHSDVKGKDIRTMNWAAGGTNPDDAIPTQNADGTRNDIYGGLTDSEVASQTKESLKYAVDRGEVDANRASRILDDRNIASSLKPAQRKLLEDAAGRSGGTPAVGGAGDGGRSHQELMERTRQLMGQGGTVPTAPSQGGTLNVPHGPTVATNPGTPTVATGPTVSISPDTATVPTGPTVPINPATTRITPQSGGDLPTTRINPSDRPTTPINPRQP